MIKDLENSVVRSVENSQHVHANLLLALFGLFAPMATFILAVSGLSYQVKVAGLAGIAAVYAAVCVWSFSRLRTARRALEADGAGDDTPSIASRLDALEDARHFFGNSLRSGDMFRLVTSRVGEILPHTGAVLMLAGPERDSLRIAETDISELMEIADSDIPADEGLAGLAFLSVEVEIDNTLELTRRSFKTELPAGSTSAAAVPLVHEGLPFGVLQLLFAEPLAEPDSARPILEAIGDRVSPLFLSSISFERTLSNALTDPLTGLPNERSFYMVLENQLAESHRFRDERPLSVLAIDIKGFEELNRKVGHSFGDDTLRFVADRLRSELRKMDFLARSMNDEFLAILPTASEQTANEVVDRIRSSFEGLVFPSDSDRQFFVHLNFGSATFWDDGETAKQLMQHAQLKKQQAKSEHPDNVVWFPKQYVN